MIYKLKLIRAVIRSKDIILITDKKHMGTVSMVHDQQFFKYARQALSALHKQHKKIRHQKGFK